VPEIRDLKKKEETRRRSPLVTDPASRPRRGTRALGCTPHRTLVEQPSSADHRQRKYVLELPLAPCWEPVMQPDRQTSEAQLGVFAVTPSRLTITDLGTPESSTARDINDAGQVVGDYWQPWQAFLWERGTWMDVAMHGDDYSHALAINNRGQVVGYRQTATGEAPFLWEDGFMTDLVPPGGAGHESRAVDINDGGQVVGYSQTATGEERAFVWDKGVSIPLGTLGGSTREPFGINDRGQVVGYSQTAAGEAHAFLWEDGVMTDLNEATDVLPFGPFAVANALKRLDEKVQPPD
jgi:probable HAF family extracellular repeat protein